MLKIKAQKCCLVLGAFSKVGIPICNKLSSMDYLIFKHGLKIRNENNYIQADLSTTDGLNFLFSAIPNKIDLFISCLGGNRGFNNQTSFENGYKIKQEDLEFIFKMNFFTNVLCIEKLINAECKKIIFIGSDIVGNPRSKGEASIYACAKSALHEYTIHLANELKEVSINCISPGGITISKTNQMLTWLEKIIKHNITGNVIRIKE